MRRLAAFVTLAATAGLVLLVATVAYIQGVMPVTPPPSPRAAASPYRVDPEAPFPERRGTLPALTLTDLFHPDYVLSTDPYHVRTLRVTGDVIPARGVNYFASRRNDFLWPFRPTADYVRDADITYINLESPLFAGCPVVTEGFTFCGNARFVDGLTLMGTKVANLANNHLTNYGAQGTTATVQLLESHGIQTSGLGPAAIIEVRGLKFGFIGFNGVGRAIDRGALKGSIEGVRSQADVVIVQFHWGKEYERQPMPDRAVPTPDDPVEIGHLAIDWGADLVIGNHPHWYQGVEVYKGKLITYAHGNFVFDQMWSEETREGVIGTYTFYDDRLVAASWKAVRIYDYGQPQFMNDADAAQVLRTMEGASKELAARLHEPTS